jgi:hypothetical protein
MGKWIWEDMIFHSIVNECNKYQSLDLEMFIACGDTSALLNILLIGRTQRIKKTRIRSTRHILWDISPRNE